MQTWISQLLFLCLGEEEKNKTKHRRTLRQKPDQRTERVIFSTVGWKMVCTCRMGGCILLNFYYTWISYRVTFWLFPPCNSHNSTCLTFPSSPAALGEQVPLCGRRPPCRNSGTLSWEGCPWGTHRKFQTPSDTKRFMRSSPPPPLGLDHPRTTHGRTQKVLHKKKKKNSKSFPLLIALRDKNSVSHQKTPPALSGHSEKSQRWKA